MRALRDLERHLCQRGLSCFTRLGKNSLKESIQALARLSKRDIRVFPTDITILEDLGLIDMKRKKEGRRESKPTVNYNRINLEITV